MILAAVTVILVVLPGQSRSVGVPLVLAATFFAVRSWLCGVRVGTNGVTVRRLCSTGRAKWAEIERFTVGLIMDGGYPCTAIVSRTNGKRPLPLFGIDAGRFPTEESAREVQVVVAALNRELEGRR